MVEPEELDDRLCGSIGCGTSYGTGQREKYGCKMEISEHSGEPGEGHSSPGTLGQVLKNQQQQPQQAEESVDIHGHIQRDQNANGNDVGYEEYGKIVRANKDAATGDILGIPLEGAARSSAVERTRELMFLMIHALHGMSGMQDVGAMLSEKALARGLLPQRTDYTGHVWNEGYQELKDRFKHVPERALMDAMQLLERERMSSEGSGKNTDGRKKVGGEGSFLDRQVLGEHNVLYTRELALAPDKVFRSLPSMHYGSGKGENACVYTELLRPVGYLRECREGIGLGLNTRHAWTHQFTIRGHSMAAYCVVYNRTGDLIITGSDDRLVKIWSSRTGLLLRSCRGHLQEVSDLTVSHDNKVLASASVDGAIRLWNIDMAAMGTHEFGSLVGTLIGHTSLVSSLNFSPVRDHELLSSSFDGTCRVWDISDGSHVSMEWNWRGRQQVENTMSLRRRDASNHEDGSLSLRPRRRRDNQDDGENPTEDANDALEEGQEEEDDHKVSIALFSSDGRHIIAGIANSCICVWEWHPAKEGEEARVSRVELLRHAHTSDVYLLQQSHSDSWIASASRDGVVCIWKPGKGGHHRRLVPIDTWKISTAFVAPSQDEDSRSRRRKGPPPRVDQVVWNADDTMVLASVQNFKVLVYSITENRVVGELGGIHEEPVHVVLSHPYDPRVAMTASYSGEVVLWDIYEGTPIKIFNSVDTRPDGRKWPDPIAYVDGFMSPDGQYAAFTDAAGQLHVVGIGTVASWISRAPYDQFLSTDYEDLVVDDEGIVRSAETGEPADSVLGTEVLCDATATPYPHGFQVAYRNGNLLSSSWRDVAWIQPGQQPGYVMAAPTLTAAQWRVYASGGSENAAQQALTRAQLRLQEHERQIDMSEEGQARNNNGSLNARNISRRNGQRDRLWETVDDSDFSSEDDYGDGSRRARVRPSRQSQRLAAMRDSDNEIEDVYDEELTEEQQRMRQQMERERRLRRRELARTTGPRGVRQSNRVRVRSRIISDSASESISDGERESSENVSLVSEHDSEEAPGPSRRNAARGPSRKRERSSDSPASEPREMRHYQWIISHRRFEWLYVPQKGDEVVYIRKGHESALADLQEWDQSTPPWESLRGGDGIRAAEPCLVQEMKYFIANDGTLGTGVSLTLEFIDSNCPVRGKTFNLNLYSPISGLPDYIVLRTLFEATVSYKWSADDGCQAMFWEDEEEKWFPGKVLEDTLSDFHIPEDPYQEAGQLWERFGVQWSQDSESTDITHHSPWEIRSPDVATEIYDKESVHPSVITRMLESIGEASKNASWELFQIAPLVDDCYQSRRLVPEFYNQVVALPIGLTDISSRLENNYYRRVSAIKDDISLIAKNAAEFNGEDAEVSNDAKSLANYLSAVLDGSADVADAEIFSAKPASSSDDDEGIQTRSRPSRRGGARRGRRTRQATTSTRPQRRRRTRHQEFSDDVPGDSEEEMDEDDFVSYSGGSSPSQNTTDDAPSSDGDAHQVNTRRTRIRLSNTRERR